MPVGSVGASLPTAEKSPPETRTPENEFCEANTSRAVIPQGHFLRARTRRICRSEEYIFQQPTLLEREPDKLVASPPSPCKISHSAECDQGFHPMDPAAFKKAGETFAAAKPSSGYFIIILTSGAGTVSLPRVPRDEKSLGGGWGKAPRHVPDRPVRLRTALV